MDVKLSRMIWIIWNVIILVTLSKAQQSVPECFKRAQTDGAILCEDTDLTSVDSSVYSSLKLSNTKIQSITLRRCKISNLNFLKSSSTFSVKTLILDSINGLSSDDFSEDVLGHITRNLEYLSISNTSSLKSIDGLKSVPRWHNLETLYVTGTGIEEIHPDLFTKIPSVKEIELNGNHIRELNLEKHNNVGKLLRISAKNNLIETIKGLERFFNLQKIDFSGNRLRQFSSLDQLLAGNIELEAVFLSNNKLQSIELEKQPRSTTRLGLKFLHLDHNEIKEISDLGNSYAKQVQVLRLGENDELILTENTLKGLTELKELYLNGCNLESIASELKNLPSLQILDLKSNKIKDVSKFSFEGTDSIDTLFLQGNQLNKLEFLTTGSVSLDKLTRLDISGNELDSLENFVSAPQLVQLRMNGGDNTNRFAQLSACKMNKLPSTLKSICALDIELVNPCHFNTFINLTKTYKILYNNKLCCGNPRHKCCTDTTNCNSEYPEISGCPETREESCAITPVPPGVAGDKSPDGSQNSCELREAFTDLYESEKIVIGLGYILALIFFIMVLILFVRRVRTYDKWLKDHREGEDLQFEMGFSPEQVRMGDDSVDVVDGPSTSKRNLQSPKLSAAGRPSPKMTAKSLDNISLASAQSHYSTIGKNTFAKRDKFKDGASIDMDPRYTSPLTKTYSQESGEDSPTAMSVYSYASYQPERRRTPEITPPTERRRHRSGGAIPSRGKRSRSEDFLETASIDSDLVPPKILLERKATGEGGGPSPRPIIRNTRTYSSTPHRSKGKGRKKSVSPLLVVKQLHRNPGAPTPPMNRRALPATPNTANGSPHSMRSVNSSLASSGGSFGTRGRHNNVFAMDDDGFITTETTVGFG